jgi:Zn-dependent protease with chaperone function
LTDLTFLVHGFTLAFAWLLLFNVAATVLVTVLAARLTKRSFAASPNFWLALRLAPAALSLAFAAFIFIPSYWQYEPREFVEGFDVSLTALAAAALAVIVAAIARGLSAWRSAKRRTDAMIRAGRPMALANTSMPAFAVDTNAPMMALVGVLRPRLLITRPVLDALTDEEFNACVAHELGHWRAMDNLKRLAMRGAPDLLFVTSAARALERRWVAASEQIADSAAGHSEHVRCALASALVKVARITPMVSSITEPISALVDGGDITERVRRLLDDAPSAAASRTMRWLPVAIPAAALALAYSPLLRIVHSVTEILVNSLP